MFNDALDVMLRADGAVCGALVDSVSGMMLGGAGQGLDLELAAAAAAEVLRSELQAIKLLGLNATLEDILITLREQYHIIHPVQAKTGLFLYLVLDKTKANLALARRYCQAAEGSLTS